MTSRTKGLSGNKSVLRAIRLLLLLLTPALIVGCETPEAASTGGNSPQQNLSVTPWNRPASWEGPGAYGSYFNQAAQ